MAYVNMTKDFSNVKMNIPGLKITKRQLLAVILAGSIGLPIFYALYFICQADLTSSVLGVFLSAGPAAGLILFKKDNLGMEKHIKYFYETHFVRNTYRPYQSDNLHELMNQETKLRKEVERIVFRGKSKAEIKDIKASGQITEVKFKGNVKISVPLKGPIDAKTKKELEKAVAKAKVKGAIPATAQDTIPYRVPYEDGTFESAEGYYTQTISYEDINYELLDNEPKNILFERWCSLINYFEPDVHFEFNYGNMELNTDSYAENFMLKPQADQFNQVRKEYSDMQIDKFLRGTNNLRKERYLTYGVHAPDYKSAKTKLNNISKQLRIKLKNLGARSKLLSGYERLELLFRIFHPASGEKLLWNWDMPVNTGLSSKDFIAPDSFSFKFGPDLNAAKYFRVGNRIGAVNYIQIFASDMEDRIIADMLSLDSNIWISIHSDNIPRNEALRMAKDNIINIQAMIQSNQKDAVRGGYDMDLLPPELQVYRDASDKLYSDLQRKDEKLFNAVITVVQTAATRKELEDNINELNGILTSYQCRLIRLDNRQEQGYMSSLPLGNNTIEVKRTFTTTDMAIFIPFTTKEIFNFSGQYYGMNPLSNNVVMLDRKRLANPNGLIFGMPGFGKTFFVKREILDTFLKTKDDRLIIDPEGEYKWLVKMLGGQIIKISLNSHIYINPLEINIKAQNEQDKDYDPVSAKINFVVSMCELILGNNAYLGKNEVAVIDEACRRVYFKYEQNPIPENMPILEDLYNEMRNMEGEKKAIGLNLSIALSRYVTGSLSYFNHRSNVDINSRLVCFDLKEMNANQRDLTMLIIQDTIWNRVSDNRSEGKWTWVDIDEFHSLLRSPITAAYSVDIWKRFRKWGGIPTGITQNIKDLFRSPEIQNILDTTNFIVMLNQAGDDARLLAEHLDLSEDEISYLKSGEAGKGLLWVEQSKVPFEDEFPHNTICYRVMTTKPEEMIKAKKQ